MVVKLCIFQFLAHILYCFIIRNGVRVLEIITDHNQTIKIVFPDELDNFESMINCFTWFGKKLSNGSIAILQNKIHFYKKNDHCGFYLGYYFYNNVENDTPIIVDMYNNGMGYQRVQWENAKCEKCNTLWVVANPTYFELYPNHNFNINELKYPLLNCQKCGGKLSRPTIWMKLCDKT